MDGAVGNSGVALPLERDRRGTPADALRAMLEPRSIAIVGASARPGSFGHRMVTEVAPQHRAPRRPPGQPAVRRDRRPAVRRLPRRPGRAGRPGADGRAGRGPRGAAAAGRRPRRPVGHRLRQRGGRGRRREQPARRPSPSWPGRPGWRSAAAAAWASSTSPGACGPSVTSRPTRCRPGRSPWSRTPARPSRRCCAAIAGSASRSPCRPARSWSRPRPTTWATPSTSPRPASWPCCWRRCARRTGCAPGWPGRPSRDVPVVALTVGTSGPGAAMVAAHSGALAGADGAWEALFDAYGVLRVRDLDELADTLELFAAGRRPRPGAARDRDRARQRGRARDGRRPGRRGGGGVQPAAARHGRPADRAARPGADPRQPARRLGHGRRHPRPVRRVVARDGRRPRRRGRRPGDRPGPRVRRRRVLSPCAAGHLGLDRHAVGSAVDDALRAWTRCRRSDSGPHGVPVLEGARSGLVALQHLATYGARDRSTRPSRATPARPGPAGRLAGPAGRPHPAGRGDVVRAAGRLRHPGRPHHRGRHPRRGGGRGAGDRRPGGGQDRRPGARAQVRRRWRAARPGRRRRRGRGVRRAGRAAGPARHGVGDGAAVASSWRSASCATRCSARSSSWRPAACWSSWSTTAPWRCRRSAGPWPARALGRLRVSRLLAGYRGAPAADTDAVLDVVVALSTLAVELGDAIDAIDINPVLVGPERRWSPSTPSSYPPPYSPRRGAPAPTVRTDISRPITGRGSTAAGAAPGQKIA